MRSVHIPSCLAIIAIVACRSIAQQGPDDSTRSPSISDDGRFVAFDTRAGNLINVEDQGLENVYWMDRKTRKIYNAQFTGPKTVYGGAIFPQISNDGEWVTFQSSNRGIPDNETTNVFVSAVRSRTAGLVRIQTHESKCGR